MDLGLRGWVANEADGSVHCVAEGPRGDLEALLARSERARRARVDRVEAAWSGGRATLGRFEIRSGGHRGD